MQQEDRPVKIDTPDAVARHQINVGTASEYGELSGEYFTLSTGSDIDFCGYSLDRITL